MLGAEEIGTEIIERTRQQVEFPRAEARARLRLEVTLSRRERHSATNAGALATRWAGRLMVELGRRLLEAGDRLGQNGSGFATPGQ